LFGHQTPLSGEHSRLNGCPVSLDHYTLMISEDWLCAYRDIEMIGYGLGIISKRLSRPEGLDGLFEHLKGNYEVLSADFSDFYPALQAFARLPADAQAMR
ncbi:ACP phosphodiesterase, partial [Pseudomonas alliivorans]|nr:ACP phosphodiesterase [Pseudomonas alliivorans]